MSDNPHDLAYPEVPLPATAQEPALAAPAPEQRRFLFSLRDVGGDARRREPHGPSTEGFFVHREKQREANAAEALEKAQLSLDLEAPSQGISVAGNPAQPRKSGWNLFGR